MLLTRSERLIATARLLPSAPIIGMVVVLSALGLGPTTAPSVGAAR
ncbi:MAG: hypothetical protein PGN13_00380 [Patulibacter minatonensis]